MKKITIISSLCIIIDQLTKMLILNVMPLDSSKEIIKDFFYISHVHNYGAAWSILNGGRVILILISLIIMPLIYQYLIKNRHLKKIEILSYGLLVGGIIGNMIDRIIHGYVIDFLNFLIFSYDFPVFNIADSCIVISVILIILFVKDDKNAISSK